MVGHNAAIMPLPDWARSMYRIWAAVQAVTLLIVVTTAGLFAFVRPPSCSETCGLELEVKLFIATVTVGLAIGLFALARQPDMSWRLLPLYVGCSVSGIGVAWLNLVDAAGGDPAPAWVYRSWYALPVALWPGIAAIATLVVGLAAQRIGATRVTFAAWTVLAVAVSAYVVTYLLPATDPRVAAWHDQGIVLLPSEAGWLTAASGQTVVRDRDPMIERGGGYEITLTAGRWTVNEMCVSPLGSLSYRSADIDVRPGRSTTVPGLCPTG